MSLILIKTDKDIRFGTFNTQSWIGNNKKKKIIMILFLD